MKQTNPSTQKSDQKQPKTWQIIFIAIVAVIFTVVWLGGYNALMSAIWSNPFVTSNRWTIPVGVLFFSLLVGLLQKYMRAPTVIHGGMKDSFSGSQKIDISNFPGALLSSYASLLSGASVGPEGPLGLLVRDIAEWFRRKLQISNEEGSGFLLAAMSSAYNGIIGSPLFTALMGTELKIGGNSSMVYIVWSLLAGVIGYAFFAILHLHVFAQYIPFTPISTLKPEYFVYAFLLGIVGAILAIFTGIAFQFFGKIMERFDNRVVERTLIAGIVVAVAVYFFPQVMFAGETQIFPMIQNPAAYGILLLLWLGILKILLLALSFKSGFLGGPTFPILFAATMIGLALHLIFPGIPISILILCIEAGTFALTLGAPITAILLVAVIGTADPYTIALLVLSATVGLLVGNAVKRVIAARQMKQTTSVKPTAKQRVAI